MQTIIRGAMKRKLKGGATNHKVDKSRVDVTLSGDNAAIDDLVSVLRSGKEINNWGAKVRRNVVLYALSHLSIGLFHA